MTGNASLRQPRDVGWVSVLDAQGVRIARGHLHMDALAGDEAPAWGATLESLHITADPHELKAGIYSIELEGGEGRYAVAIDRDVSAGDDVTPLRWLEPDAPPALYRLGEG